VSGQFCSARRPIMRARGAGRVSPSCRIQISVQPVRFADGGPPLRAKGYTPAREGLMYKKTAFTGRKWRRGPGSNRRIKVLQFTEPRLSRYESRALPLGEVPKNRLFSTHFLLIGSLTAARIRALRRPISSLPGSACFPFQSSSRVKAQDQMTRGF